MTISIAIAEKITTLRQVEEKLGLTLSGDSQFFTEWMADLPALSEAEQTFIRTSSTKLSLPNLRWKSFRRNCQNGRAVTIT
ncbi:hypothetical protein LC612_36320 [Nostoc sp. CHAB 5834]|nr:hypothetical protein [Nostoc sp. CHAB 5834]